MKTPLLRRGCLAIIVIAAIYIVSAGLAGILFKNRYVALLAQVNSSDQVHVTLHHYQRGWFYSHAVVTVDIINPAFVKAVTVFGILPEQLPRHYVIEQTIQHGPIVYSAGRYSFAEAVLEQTLHPSNRLYQLGGARVELEGIVGHFGILAGFQNNKIEDNVHCEKITVRDAEGGTLSLSDANFAGFFAEVHGLLRGERRLDITTIQFEHQTIGPLHIKFSAFNLDAASLAAIAMTYQQVIQRGELYHSQLHYKLGVLLPKVVSPASRFVLNAFNLATPVGSVTLHGNVVWSGDTEVFPDNIVELLQAAQVRATLHIAKPLTATLIHWVAGYPYFDQARIREHQAYQAARTGVQFAMQQNAMSILSLVTARALSEQDAEMFLTLQDQFVPMQEYATQIQTLFLSKEISADVSHLLNWQYAEVQRTITVLQQLVKHYRQKTVSDMQKQFNLFLQQGYIVDDGRDYNVSIERAQGQTLLNSHQFK